MGVSLAGRKVRTSPSESRRLRRWVALAGEPPVTEESETGRPVTKFLLSFLLLKMRPGLNL